MCKKKFWHDGRQTKKLTKILLFVGLLMVKVLESNITLSL